jgi:hypothetical protein
MSTHLYLDIDGVLNACSNRFVPKDLRAWPEYVEVNKYEIVAPAMIERLNEVIAKHGIIGHWLTTWEREAPEFGGQIGLAGSDGWAWLPTHYRDGFSDTWGKFQSIQEHTSVTQPTSAIWIDDDLATEPAARAWAKANGVIALAPTAGNGITPQMLDRIDAELSGLAA